MHCVYCSMPKGTSQAEAMLNSEKIKNVALAIVELCWSGHQFLWQISLTNAISDICHKK